MSKSLTQITHTKSLPSYVAEKRHGLVRFDNHANMKVNLELAIIQCQSTKNHYHLPRLPVSVVRAECQKSEEIVNSCL